MISIAEYILAAALTVISLTGATLSIYTLMQDKRIERLRKELELTRAQRDLHAGSGEYWHDRYIETAARLTRREK